MNRRVILAATIALLGSDCVQGLAADAKTAKSAKNKAPIGTDRSTNAEVHTAKHAYTHDVRGTLTLDQAVEIALRQNPAILQAIQDIERTRGLIIEVRASALPHLTLAGDFEWQDRRLLRGGGFSSANESGTAVNTNGLTPTLPTITNSQVAAVTTPAITTGAAPGNVSTGSSTTPTAAASIAPVSGGGSAVAAASTVSAGPLLASRAESSNAIRQTTTATTTAAGTTTTQTAASASTNTSAILKELQQAQGTGTTFSNAVQDKSWNITLEATQALYTGGQVQAAIRIAKLTQDSSYYQLRDTVDQVIAQVREQFYLVLLNRALITVSEEAVRLAEDQLKDQQNRFEAGTVPRFNVLTAEVSLANTKPTLIRARNDYLLTQIQLAKLLGLDPGAGGKPDFYCVGDLTVSQRHLSLPDALALARARRPFLKVQRQTMLIDAENVKVELAGYKPRLDAHAGVESRNNRTSDDVGNVVNGWFFGVTGSWNIFDGFQTYGQVKQARARLEQSRINYEDSVRQVDLEVQTAIANLEAARQTTESQRKNVESALEALRLAQERFSAGAGTQLDVLNARVSLTQSRTTELQARSDYNRALAELDRVTATNTVYAEGFKDPLAKTEKGIFARLAETGLPPVPPKDSGK